jgi:spore maturation protein SpmB
MSQYIYAIKGILKETLDVLKELFAILIPAIIVVKILKEAGVVEYLSQALEPFMGLFGLPGEMAIVWTTGIVTNIYGAIAVFMMLTADVQLSGAQMSVLCTMLLIAHALPVELALTHRVGGHFLYLGLVRLAGAIFCGIILHQIYSYWELLKEPAVILWTGQLEENNLWDWGLNQINNLAFIAVVLFSLLLMMRILNAIGFTDLLARMLKPLLVFMGISQHGASIAVFGLLAGITFGSGLLLAEVKNNQLPSRDIVLVLTFLSLCHGIIEDTTLMLMMGGHLSGILYFRLAFAAVVLAILSRIPRLNLDLLRTNQVVNTNKSNLIAKGVQS